MRQIVLLLVEEVTSCRNSVLQSLERLTTVPNVVGPNLLTFAFRYSVSSISLKLWKLSTKNSALETPPNTTSSDGTMYNRD